MISKKNFVEVLARAAPRPSWTGEYVAIGTATDCYQPIEGHYKLTRRAIAALLDARNPIGIVTKGPMIVRDRDLLVALSKITTCTVYMSVPTVDEQAWERLEPGTAPPLQRLRAVRELVDAGVNAGVLMNPIVPGFTSSRAKLERTVKAIADHGALSAATSCFSRTAPARICEHRARFPAWLPRYEKLYERNARRRTTGSRCRE
jgi:DNA repair photolyase